MTEIVFFAASGEMKIDWRRDMNKGGGYIESQMVKSGCVTIVITSRRRNVNQRPQDHCQMGSAI